MPANSEFIDQASQSHIKSNSALAEHSIQNSDVLTQDSILKHKAECKLDNKLRLKEVKNLEELIQFKIKTVSV